MQHTVERDTEYIKALETGYVKLESYLVISNKKMQVMGNDIEKFREISEV